MIDYKEEYKKEFETSHFWYKNNKIQLLWYLWEAGKDKKDLSLSLRGSSNQRVIYINK